MRWRRSVDQQSESGMWLEEHERRGEEYSRATRALLAETTLEALAGEPGYRERGARLARLAVGRPAPHLAEAFAAGLAIRERILDGPDPHSGRIPAGAVADRLDADEVERILDECGPPPPDPPGSYPSTPREQLFIKLISLLMDWPADMGYPSLGPDEPSPVEQERERVVRQPEVRWVVDGIATDHDNLAYREYQLAAYVNFGMDPDWVAHAQAKVDEARAQLEHTQSDIWDPHARNEHLLPLDTLLLCEFDRPRSTIELHAIARTYPDVRRVVTHPRADLLCPLLWRWANDASHRGVIAPEARPATATTRWQLTGVGAWHDLAFQTGRHMVARWLRGALKAEPMRPSRDLARPLGRLIVRGCVEREASLQAAAATLDAPPDAWSAPADWAATVDWEPPPD